MACECKDPVRKECDECRAYEAQKRRERLDARIERSGLPASLRGLSLLGIPSGPVGEAARDWVAGELKGVCLTGPVGAGKTWAAAAAAWARVQNHPLQWVSVARMMSQLRSGFGSEDKAAADRIVSGTGAVVLDDLDKVNPTDYGREVLFAAIDNRVEEGSSLFVTTNKPLSGLKEMLGAPVASRLAGYCTTVRMDGADRRLS